MHRQPRSVGGDNRAGLAELRYTSEQSLFNLKIFGYDLDDPVSVLAALQIVFKIPKGDFVCHSGSEKCGWLGLFRGIQANTHNFIALRGVGGGQTRWDDIQQQHRDAGVCEMSRDSSAHGSGAKHHDFFDATFHSWPFFLIRTNGQVTKPTYTGQSN